MDRSIGIFRSAIFLWDATIIDGATRNGIELDNLIWYDHDIMKGYTNSILIQSTE